MLKRPAARAQSQGDDILDLDDVVDRIILEYDYSFWIPSNFDKVNRTVQDWWLQM